MVLSLIVPVYNLAAYLDETLGSVTVARQALGVDAKEVEVICVDDGSTDGSGARLDVWASDVGFRVIHKANGGPGAARNAGLEVAQGDYVFFLDGDDVLLPNALVVAFRLLRGHPCASVISMRFAAYVEDGRLPEPTDGRAEREIDVRTELPAVIVSRLGIFPTLFERETIFAVRFGDLPLGEDRLFVMQCLARADTVVVSDALVEGYRVREGSLARTPWSHRKIRSLNDHAVRGLAALAASGKRIEPAGAGYLASLVVSEAPVRILRLLRRGPEMDELWAHWIASVRTLPTELLPRSVRLMRQAVLALSFSRGLSLGCAHVLRRLGIA